MASDAYDLLDGPLIYLAQDLVDAVAPVTLVAASEVALPLFTRPETASDQLPRLPVPDGVGIAVRTVAADDPRGKEEVLRAAIANGAVRVVFDPGDGRRVPAGLAIELALGHVVGHKRNSACI